MVVAVTGAGGQLGQALQSIAQDYPEIDFHFYTSKEIDITKITNIEAVWQQIKPDFCINAAAYTAVDKAETESEKAHLVNVVGAKNIAQVCEKFQTTLLHISTDFVFGGDQNIAYTETDATHPQGVYAKTKRDGELEIMSTAERYFIIRTSWLYSGFGNNFMKTMLRLAREKTSISVVDDQIGSPTSAVDLAEMLLRIIKSNNSHYGIYHYSNEGQTSWYGFAAMIFELNDVAIELHPIPTEQYPTPAKRPKYSVLNTSKIKNEFGPIPSWEEALKRNTTQK